jgi:hypothetical protein
VGVGGTTVRIGVEVGELVGVGNGHRVAGVGVG